MPGILKWLCSIVNLHTDVLERGMGLNHWSFLVTYFLFGYHHLNVCVLHSFLHSLLMVTKGRRANSATSTIVTVLLCSQCYLSINPILHNSIFSFVTTKSTITALDSSCKGIIDSLPLQSMEEKNSFRHRFIAETLTWALRTLLWREYHSPLMSCSS